MMDLDEVERSAWLDSVARREVVRADPVELVITLVEFHLPTPI